VPPRPQCRYGPVVYPNLTNFCILTNSTANVASTDKCLLISNVFCCVVGFCRMFEIVNTEFLRTFRLVEHSIRLGVSDCVDTRRSGQHYRNRQLHIN